MVDERKCKHLELVQGVINRLSTNSFLLKGWSVVLVAALFALSAAESRIEFVFLAFIPVIVFWGLDGFFLCQEKLYRKLYDHVRHQSDKDIDFSMDITPFKTSDGPNWVKATFSKTLVPFHCVLFASILIVLILTIRGAEC